MTTDSTELTIRDILLDILDRLDRIETAQAQEIREVADIRSREDTNGRMLKVVWTVIMLMVTGLIGLAFFVLQSSLRFPIPGVTS